MLRLLIEHHETEPGVWKALDGSIAGMTMIVKDKKEKAFPTCQK